LHRPGNIEDATNGLDLAFDGPTQGAEARPEAFQQHRLLGLVMPEQPRVAAPARLAERVHRTGGGRRSRDGQLEDRRAPFRQRDQSNEGFRTTLRGVATVG
jgi:hypothetical protein